MRTYITFLAILLSTVLFSQNNIVNHKLNVKVNIKTSEITVIDSITVNGDYNNIFSLNSALQPFSTSKNIKLTKVAENEKASDVGMDRDKEDNDISLTKWKITGNDKSFVISYKGKIIPKQKQNKEEYQRGFSSYSGIINDKGTYLAGSTYWVPVFDDKLITFTLKTELPKDWKNVTIGKRLAESSTINNHFDTWICDKPQEEVFLIAAKFTEYSHSMNNGTMAMAFLRTPDEGIANKYLEVTEQYMAMYEEMLGKYPYKKFALVENFWETGYGMPSFTLLGEKIIRFPFILHSSYPHELLHNWWGNSVYVDFNSGNWCEGITVFMADHLIKEQRGIAEEYRRATLQKFTNYVTPENDFPLTEFLARNSSFSEAIGYGKAMMMWQMLRRKLGNDIFIKGFRKFYKDNIYKVASYTDIRKAMEAVSGQDLEQFFTQWTTRKGAPEIAIKQVKTDMYAGKYRVNITIEQVQKADVFNIDLPINIVTEKGIESYAFNMDKREQNIQISLNSKPLKLVVDPQYDVFRILNPNEVPPTLSKIWGSKNNIIILPKKADKEQLAIYQQFAVKWQETDNDNFEIKFDSDIKYLPKDKTVWIIGFKNKFANSVNDKLLAYSSNLLTDSVKFDKKNITKSGNSFICTLFEKDDINRQRIFIAFDNEKAIDGLVRKLPHYGKYSYLAFTGDEPTNIAKGQWAVLNSPLVKIFDKKAELSNVIQSRKALATLKPVFSENRMMTDIKYLASEELKGRGLGTPELDVAAKYISEKFKKAGLKSINGTYYQKFTHKFKDKGVMKLTNIIGIIEGTDPKLKDEPVIVSAHYDHLGLGWPDVRKGNEGKIHYGADDNASGVATIIELATTMAKTTKPKRTIVFLACSGEEAGLIGSRYFVAHSKEMFKGDIFADLNIDTDGSLFDTKILVLNGNSAKEWKFIFMGTDYTTGIKSDVIEKPLDASDQVSFIEEGIPAVQLFTGPTQNYHRPSDTFDKIDGKGLVKVATVAKEVITYLADREDAMHYTGNAKKYNNTKTNKPKTERKVSTGSMPDFAYKGVGVRIGSVIPNSAGADSGLRSGDIIIEIDGKNVQDLKQYSDLLKTHNPKDKIKLKIIRNNKEQIIDLILGER